MKIAPQIWLGIGPIPIDAELEEKLASVKHDNNHPAAKEAEWIKQSLAFGDEYAASEDKFFNELEKRIN